MSKQPIFRLNPETFLAVGLRRSVIHNLYTGEAMWCDEPTTAALVRSESNESIAEPPELFASLAQRGWGFFADRPVFVDKLRTFNVFREKRLWKETPFASLAVLQVTNACTRACPTCATAFCPICTSLPSRQESLATDEWLALIEELARFGTQLLLLTGGEAFLRDDLPRLVEAGRARGMHVQVHTSGLLPIPDGLPDDIGFSILMDDGASAPAIVERFRGRRTVAALVDRSLDVAALSLPAEWTVKPISAAAPKITRANLVVTPFERFFARKTTDDCLNGKIYVAHDGRVFPCFGYRGSPIADLRKDGLSQAVRRLVDDWWSVGVDRRAQPCGGCEFRHCCNSCRFVDAGACCAYDMPGGVWREDTDVPDARAAQERKARPR